ncbi:hypothetical protein ABK040_010878 [Willaertia magna]
MTTEVTEMDTDRKVIYAKLINSNFSLMIHYRDEELTSIDHLKDLVSDKFSKSNLFKLQQQALQKSIDYTTSPSLLSNNSNVTNNNYFLQNFDIQLVHPFYKDLIIELIEFEDLEEFLKFKNKLILIIPKTERMEGVIEDVIPNTSTLDNSYLSNNLQNIISQMNPQLQQQTTPSTANTTTIITPTIGITYPIKVILVGDEGVGKSSYLQRLQNKEFPEKYEPTYGTNVIEISFYTTLGTSITFQIWDIAPTSELRQTYYLGANAVILMFDLTNPLSYYNVTNYYKEISSVLGYNNLDNKIPFVLIGNKLDSSLEKINEITFYRKHEMEFFEISVKNKLFLEKPLLYIFRKLFNDFNLNFININTDTDIMYPTSIGAIPREVNEEELIRTASSKELPSEYEDNL